MSAGREQKSYAGLGIALSVPATLAAGPLIGFWIGSTLDRHFNSTPWALGIAVFLDSVASITQVYRMLSWIAKDRDKS